MKTSALIFLENGTQTKYRLEPMKQTQWIALTGGPSSGITSLGNFLRICGFAVVPECSRGIIDLGISEGFGTDMIRLDQIEHERRILKLQNEIELNLDPNKVVIIERGTPDPVAYGMSKDEVLKYHQFKYKHVFYLERVEFLNDYARTETIDEANQIAQSIHDFYLEIGYNLIQIPKMSITNRAKFVFDHAKLACPPIVNTCESLFKK